MSSKAPVDTSPHEVLPNASIAHPSSVLSQDALQKQLALFYIGLEMLGQEKKARFLLYLLSLKQQSEEGEQTNAIRHHAT
jgi:hypothetical protein